MATISVNYAAMNSGRDGLIATWGRIESQLAELDAAVAATSDMTADMMIAYRGLKVRWDGAADQRQAVLHALATHVGTAGEQYRQVDVAIAAQFG